MFDNNSNADDILQAGDTPDVNHLIELFSSAKGDMGSHSSEFSRLQDIRYCDWAGRSEDGRKYSKGGTKAYPWEGASDLRVFKVDNVINSLSSSALCALWRARISAIPASSQDCEKAGKISQFVDWYVKSAIPNARREIELWLQWGLTQGKSVMGVFWERKEAYTNQTISAVDVARSNTLLGEYLNDEEFFDGNNIPLEFTKEARSAYGFNSDASANDFLLRLKNFGQAEYRVKTVVADGVKLRALRVGIDFFCPRNVDELESCPYVFVREYLSISDLRTRADAFGWSDDFVNSVINTASSGTDENVSSASSASADGCSFNKVEICTAYYKTHDKSGAMSLRYCVFSPSVSNSFAEAGEYDVAPQRFPFEVYVRETVERSLFDSRGVPEIAEGWQREIKTQKDARIDRVSLEINPPKLYRAGRKPTEFRPGAWIPVSAGDFKIIDEVRFGNTSSNAEQIEQQVEFEMASYFGCVEGETPSAEITTKKQAFVDTFFQACSRVLEQVYFLYRQFGQNKTIFAPISEPDGTIVEFDKNDVQSDFSFNLSFDVRDENFDLFLKKFDVSAKFIQAFDKTGSVNTSHLLKRLLGMLFPDEVKSLVSNEEDSYRRETLETQQDLAAIYSAQPVNAPEHCNAQLRLQIVSQYAQTPSVAMRMQQDQEFASALQNYAKQLQFQIQQAQNAVIGRIGTAPADGMPSEVAM